MPPPTHLSCGAAILILPAQVAAPARGRAADPQLLPDPGDPAHLARLRLTRGPAPNASERALAEAILQRHTSRDAFDVRPLPDTLLEQMHRAAHEQGARLHPVSTAEGLLALEVLLSRADRVEETDPTYRDEIASWVHAGPTEDGIPRAALPADPERGSSLRLRDEQLTDTSDRPANPTHTRTAGRTGAGHRQLPDRTDPSEETVDPATCAGSVPITQGLGHGHGPAATAGSSCGCG